MSLLFFSVAWALDINTQAPNFELTSMDGRIYNLTAFRGKVVVLEWFNPKCPFVKSAYKESSLIGVANKNSDVVWLAINSSAPKKQGHGLKVNQEAKKNWSIPYPILFDESGKVGKAYGAKTTPHMFVIDQSGMLVYQGALDNNPFVQKKDRIPYVERALEALKNGEKIAIPETKAYGCSVKYKK